MIWQNEAWPDDHVERLLKLWGEGRSGGEIGVLMGYSRSSVCGKIHRLRRGGTPIPAREKNERRINIKRGARPKAPPRLRQPKVVRSQVRAESIIRRAQLPKIEEAPIVFDASLAQPWTQRTFGQCAYPISGEGDETFSCCQPTEATYCKPHVGIMYQPKDAPKTTKRNTDFLIKRYA